MKLKSYKDKQDNIRNATDIDSYLQLPEKDRLLWGLFYIYPKYMRFDSVKDFFEDGKFETNFDKYFKRKYPIQFFFRETIPDWLGSIWAPFSKMYRKVNEFLFPRQKWLLKKIPNHWVDKDFIITTVLFESVIEFVEVETIKYNGADFDEMIKAYEAESDEWTDKETYIKNLYRIKRIYRWAKMRKRLEYKLDYSRHLREIYYNILRDYDTHFCKEIIDVREQMWT